MSKAAKIWLITAGCLIVLGFVLFAAIMTVNHWDFTKLGTEKFETRTYEFKEEFHSVLINTDTADIVFLPSEDEKCKVVCYEPDSGIHDVTVKDGKLSINWLVYKKWYEHIGITVESPKITVYLPHSEYVSLSIRESTGDVSIPNNFKFDSIDISASTGDVTCLASASGAVKIKVTTGKITVENVTAASLRLTASTGDITVSNVKTDGDISAEVTTGKVYLTNVTCKSLDSEGDTGDITLKNVIASGRFSIERDTGDVKFEKCDAASISVETDTGDVTGSLLSDKVFSANSDTGKVSVPKTTSGGRCEIETDTGDINITVG